MDVKHPFALVENAWRLKELMIENRLVMVYSDHITIKSYEYLVHLAEDKLEHHKTDVRSKKKILNILVEVMQNIHRHGHRDTNNTVASLFVIGQDDKEHYFVIAGNTITTDKQEALKQKIDHINSMDAPQLRHHYKNVIQADGFSEKGGAGLGLIDIARKSQSKIDYHFTKVNSEHSFFTFKVNIEPKEDDER